MCYIYNNNIYKKPNLHIYIYIFCRHGSSQPDRKKTGKKWGSSIFRHVDSCIIIGCKPIYIPLFILLFLSAFLLFPFLSYPSFPLRALSLSLSLSLSLVPSPLFIASSALLLHTTLQILEAYTDCMDLLLP